MIFGLILAIFKGHFVARPNRGDFTETCFEVLGPIGIDPHREFFSYISVENSLLNDHCGLDSPLGHQNSKILMVRNFKKVQHHLAFFFETSIFLHKNFIIIIFQCSKFESMLTYIL